MTHESLAERVLWKKLKGKALCGFRFLRRKTFGSFRCSFYCPKAKLAVDLQGDPNDAQKDSTTKIPNLTVLHFSNLDVYRNRDNVLNAIMLALPKGR